MNKRIKKKLDKKHKLVRCLSHRGCKNSYKSIKYVRRRIQVYIIHTEYKRPQIPWDMRHRTQCRNRRNAVDKIRLRFKHMMTFSRYLNSNKEEE